MRKLWMFHFYFGEFHPYIVLEKQPSIATNKLHLSERDLKLIHNEAKPDADVDVVRGGYTL